MTEGSKQERLTNSSSNSQQRDLSTCEPAMVVHLCGGGAGQSSAPLSQLSCQALPKATHCLDYRQHSLPEHCRISKSQSPMNVATCLSESS